MAPFCNLFMERPSYIRTNTGTLLRRFGKCSKKVKVGLFRSYLCMYVTVLLNTYTVRCMKKTEVAITDVLVRLYSVAANLLDLQLPSLDTVMS